MTSKNKISVKEVNSLKENEFERFFGNVIELYGNAARSLITRRPFNSVMDICNAFQGFLDDLSVEDKLVVLKLHPDLAGILAARNELTPESSNEQKAAGLDQLTAADKKTIDESNRRYKEKFGFPFIICARENKVQSIIAGLRIRHDNSLEEEINTGIEEVKKICKLRILDIVRDD